MLPLIATIHWNKSSKSSGDKGKRVPGLKLPNAQPEAGGKATLVDSVATTKGRKGHRAKSSVVWRTFSHIPLSKDLEKKLFFDNEIIYDVSAVSI